ncbi:MAG: DNA mismatch repair endonuclease MutL [Muribaculaceae bacterium]|nr:DNA mismatch repair endonuclease MutL [Muribaculaceae bacterium]
MSDVIKLLPDSVANQIAAGEVIQRPASVVKELVENAVDAGASEISVIIKDAGRTLIQVVDNGCGMSATDARLAFERHSTSKIRKADDLFELRTMGFRGEALASICAVSQVDLRTMRRDDNCGTRLIINGSKVESQQPEACVPGSNMMVRNLFYNVPARRKFLKKDSVEMANIIHEFERLALVNPEVDLTLIHNDLTLHKLPAASLRKRIIDLFGKSLDQQLIPVETDTAIVKLSGFIVRPEHCRKRGALQYLFVNGRNMRHPYFHKAIMQCYEGLIPADEMPNYFINFQVDPQTIDVNIHPTKNEIKFEAEQAIRQILYAAVKETIGRYNTAPQIDFRSLTEEHPDIPALNLDHEPKIHTPATSSGSYNPFTQPSSVKNWEDLYKNFEADRADALRRAETERAEASTLNGLEDVEPTVTDATLLPIGNRYVAVADTRGMRIIDLRRAHQTVLFARFMNSSTSAASQRLLFPETAHLEPSETPLMDELEPRLAAMGFDLAALGGGDWAINAVPAGTDGCNPSEMLIQIVHEVAADSRGDSLPLVERAAAAMAIAASFRPTRRMTPAEIQGLIADLMSLSLPGFSPKGKPVFTVISEQDLAKFLQ